MSSVKVLPSQSLYDIAVQHVGNVEAVFEIASLNGLSVTDDLTAGQSLIIPGVSDARTVKILSEGDWNPASSEYARLQGIGYSRIGIDFEVWQDS